MILLVGCDLVGACAQIEARLGPVPSAYLVSPCDLPRVMSALLSSFETLGKPNPYLGVRVHPSRIVARGSIIPLGENEEIEWVKTTRLPASVLERVRVAEPTP